MSHAGPLVDEVANELATWPGVRIERGADDTAVVLYDDVELGVLDRAGASAELNVTGVERDELVEHGEGSDDAVGVSHDIRGPSDVTAVLELFDGRYREIRGESA
ncbi:MAG TPA: luciferase family protein [Solirubrobacteraceae bacterium]|nr:luciferase family protein [Solirubrobacteraceae bacterium]